MSAVEFWIHTPDTSYTTLVGKLNGQEACVQFPTFHVPKDARRDPTHAFWAQNRWRIEDRLSGRDQ